MISNFLISSDLQDTSVSVSNIQFSKSLFVLQLEIVVRKKVSFTVKSTDEYRYYSIAEHNYKPALP